MTPFWGLWLFMCRPAFINCRCVQVEKVMRALFIQSLYLWPRFEAHVKECLKASEEGLDFEVSSVIRQLYLSVALLQGTLLCAESLSESVCF